MKKLFNNINMTWKKILIMSVIIGIYTGIIMCIPILNNTSLQDIGISYECWVLFAVIIVVNCKKNYEAMLKCFVFFLISQPIIFLVEILLKNITLNMGLYYYLKIWLPITFLTLPGGFIAYYSKKENAIGSIILGIGNTIIMFLGVHYILNVIQDFPYHLLTALFCFITPVIMTINIKKTTTNKIISLFTPIILTIVLVIYVLTNGLSLM